MPVRIFSQFTNPRENREFMQRCVEHGWATYPLEHLRRQEAEIPVMLSYCDHIWSMGRCVQCGTMDLRDFNRV